MYDSYIHRMEQGTSTLQAQNRTKKGFRSFRPHTNREPAKTAPVKMKWKFFKPTLDFCQGKNINKVSNTGRTSRMHKHQTQGYLKRHSLTALRRKACHVTLPCRTALSSTVQGFRVGAPWMLDLRVAKHGGSGRLLYTYT